MKRPDWLRVKAGLLEPKHVKAIGPALWEFELLVHWQTDDDGTVNNGVPIRVSEIAEALGLPVRTTRTHMELLAPYLEERRTPYGKVYRIRNASKFQRVAEKGQSLPERVTEFGHSEPRESDRKRPRELPFLAERVAEFGQCNIRQKQKQNMCASQRTRRTSASQPFRCEHSPRCKSHPWHCCLIIQAAAGSTTPRRFSAKELAQAKILAGVSDDDIRGAVELMRREVFWRDKPILPAKVNEYLDPYRASLQSGPAAAYHRPVNLGGSQ